MSVSCCCRGQGWGTGMSLQGTPGRVVSLWEWCQPGEKGTPALGSVTYQLSLVTSVPRWPPGAFPALEERGKLRLSRAKGDPRAPRGEGGTHRPPSCSNAADHALVASRTLQGEHGKG